MGFIRKPSLRRSLANLTSLRFQLVHRLGAKMPRGLGAVRSPRRAVRNAIYSRTTMSLWDAIKILTGRTKL